MDTTKGPVPTLPAKWSPSGFGCRGKDDYWIWDFHNDQDVRTVLGGPSQTDQADHCFPSTWATVYEGTQCPQEFTPACTSATGNSTLPVTCCPITFAFSCVTETKPHGATFPCVSRFDTTRPIRVTRTDFARSTLNFQDVTQGTDRHLFALGVVYTTPTATSSQTLMPSSTDSPGTNRIDTTNHSGIGAGAAAEIGIGCGAALILIALLSWVIYRRRHFSKTTDAPGAEVASESYNPKVKTEHGPPQELSGQECRELEG